MLRLPQLSSLEVENWIYTFEQNVSSLKSLKITGNSVVDKLFLLIQLESLVIESDAVIKTDLLEDVGNLPWFAFNKFPTRLFDLFHNSFSFILV